MASLEELAARHAELSAADLDWLQLLLADWQLLADLSFADLVLWLPTWNGSGYVAAAQMRPTTGPTVFADDLSASFLPKGRRPVVDEAYAQRRSVVSREPDCPRAGPRPSRSLAPAGGIIAVVRRHSDLSVARARSRLEQSYVEVASTAGADGLRGTFPFPGGDRGR